MEAAVSQGTAEELVGELLGCHLFFPPLLGHHGGSKQAQNIFLQRHPFAMLFSQYRVHFTPVLSQKNTFASWRSSRTAVQSITTEERTNVVYVPVSPWRAKIINLSLSFKKNHKGRQTPEVAGDSVTPEQRSRLTFKPQQRSRAGDKTLGLQL